MAKRKNYHQPQPLINQINARRAVENRLANQAIQEKIESEAKIMGFLCMEAIHDAWGIGEERMLRDFIPALGRAKDRYKAEKAVDRYYANEKLRQRVAKILPSQVFTVGEDVLILDDGTVLK